MHTEHTKESYQKKILRKHIVPYRPGGLAFFHLTKKEVSQWQMKK